MRAIGKLILIGFFITAGSVGAIGQTQQSDDENRPPIISRDTIGRSAPPTPIEPGTQNVTSEPGQPADGSRHGLPLETFAVVPGTRVLVRLEEELSTGQCKANYK